jgi:hypothetical protein
MDACEQHHAPRSRLAMGLEVELMRQAALVDSTAGIVNFGLNRRWLRALFRDVSREGSWRLVGRSAAASFATARRASPVSSSFPAHATIEGSPGGGAISVDYSWI